jgi:hypothetical protein
MAIDASDLAALVTISSLEPGVEPNEANMRLALACLPRDEALILCACINAIVTGFAPNRSQLQRQSLAINMVAAQREVLF